MSQVGLYVQARRLVLAGVRLAVCGPRPAGQQGAIDDVLGVRAEVLGHGHILGQRGAQQRRQRCDGTADRGLRHSIRLADLSLDPVLRRYVNVTTTDMNNPRIGGQVIFSDSADALFTACTWAHNSTISSRVKPVV